MCCVRLWRAGSITSATSDVYGPHIINQFIREALHPYTDDLVIVIALTAGDAADVSIDHHPRHNRRRPRHTAPPRWNCVGPLPV